MPSYVYCVDMYSGVCAAMFACERYVYMYAFMYTCLSLYAPLRARRAAFKVPRFGVLVQDAALLACCSI